MVRNLQYCQDPRKKHRKKITKKLRKVTDNIIEKCPQKLIKGSLLCSNCWAMILKTSNVNEIGISTDNESMEVISTENNSFEDDDAIMQQTRYYNFWANHQLRKVSMNELPKDI